MKKICSLALGLLGVAFVIGGGYSVARGLDAKHRVRDELHAQKITTPADASIPNAAVDGARTAQAMGDVIGVHSLRATGGRTYAEFGRYAALDGNSAGTDDEAKAVKGANGRPVPHPLRNVAFEASALRTSDRGGPRRHWTTPAASPGADTPAQPDGAVQPWPGVVASWKVIRTISEPDCQAVRVVADDQPGT